MLVLDGESLFCQVLEILVRAVVEDLTDNHGNHASTQKSKLKELMGRVTSGCSTDAQLWGLYARLYGDGHSNNAEDNEKVSHEALL